MKLGSKLDYFKQEGQIWFCTNGLPSDITVEVGEISFHLHKFPLLSKSQVLEKLFEAKSNDNDDSCIINLTDLPGGAKAFELVAKFCYDIKLDLTASDVVYLRCASEHLQMTEEVSENNLISHSETLLNQVVLRSWKDSIQSLQTCTKLLPYAEDLHIVKRCIESLAVKACTDPNVFSVLWNGISTGARPKSFSLDWWYDDVSSLSFPLYKRLISVMEGRGIKEEIIAGSIVVYTKKYLPGFDKRKFPDSMAVEEQRELIKDITDILPVKKGVISTKFLCGLLRTAVIIKAEPSCLCNLERRIGVQLDEASLDDLLIPTFAHSMETLYNVDCVERILDHFLEVDKENSGGKSPCLVEDEHAIMASPSITPITKVARLIDGYLAEVAPDVNLKIKKFKALAAVVPDYARPLDDGLYRAIDVYLKAHPFVEEGEREQLCRLMDCQKLSLEACTHAAQNERLPLRIIVQVLFFEQLQLRTSIQGCFLLASSDNLHNTSRPLQTRSEQCSGGSWATAVQENQVLKVGMDNMRVKVSELEKEYTAMRQEIERLGKGKKKKGELGGVWSGVSRRLGLRIKSSQMCSAQEGSVSQQHRKKKLSINYS